ncbi:MAG: hypothetical protein BEN19_06205 [Epulopiscium sp. Nuni2H_MBin003]|nr:MAG: hypothetical protein BEN19_06205 [Epulopiscium sp. Nuni2H_MBin003]
MKKGIRISLLAIGLFVLSTGSISAFQYTTNDKIMPVVQEEEIARVINIPRDLEIVSDRQKAIVMLRHNGEILYKNTQAETVGEFLAELDIEIEETASLNTELTEKIVDGLELIVSTRELKTSTLKETVPFETIHQADTTLENGVMEVGTAGVPGIKETIIEEVYFGGELVNQIIISENMVSEPITQIINVGVPVSVPEPVATTAANNKITNSGYAYTTQYTMEATAYTDIPGDKWYNITASGMPTFVGMVAVDRNVIPLGTILYVDGYGLAIAGDTGGAINGYDIDLFMNTYNEAMQFGRRDVTVYVLEDQTLDVQAIRYGE